MAPIFALLDFILEALLLLMRITEAKHLLGLVHVKLEDGKYHGLKEVGVTHKTLYSMVYPKIRILNRHSKL